MSPRPLRSPEGEVDLSCEWHQPPRWRGRLAWVPQQLHHNDCTDLEGLNGPLPGAGRKGPHPQLTTRTHKAHVVQHGLDTVIHYSVTAPAGSAKLVPASLSKGSMVAPRLRSTACRPFLSLVSQRTATVGESLGRHARCSGSTVQDAPPYSVTRTTTSLT